jgi:polysaccharide biosynthesis protein PelC
MKSSNKALQKVFIALFVLVLTSCSAYRAGGTFHDPNMDFGAIQTVAVMPFMNLSREQLAAERARNVFITALLSTGGIYAIPPGEVARGIARVAIIDPASPSPEDVVKFAAVVKVDAVITGVVKEYGEVRAGTSAANVISLSMQMLEAQTGKVVWSASTTKGGIGLDDRLFGGGGRPMNGITEAAIGDLLDKLFK